VSVSAVKFDEKPVAVIGAIHVLLLALSDELLDLGMIARVDIFEELLVKVAPLGGVVPDTDEI
jgi:hypothetical protein